MKNHMLHAALALSLGITSPALAGQASPRSNDAAVLLQAAMHTEQVEGRLPEAIDAYKNVVAKAGANKAVAAQALLRLGAAYEKLGRPEARDAYERVVRNYPDRPKEAAAAKARLAKVGGGAVMRMAQVDITPRKVLDGLWSNPLDASADGRFAVGPERTGYNRFDLVLHDLHSGRATVLFKGAKGQHSLWTSMSDDGRRVAYNWFEGERLATLQIVGTEPGATPRAYPSAPGFAATPLDWSPDGTSLLVVLHQWEEGTASPSSSSLAWLAVDSGALRVIKKLEAWQELARRAAVSPDGRYIAYTAPPRAGSTDRYVYLIDADGQREVTVVANAGARYSPLWTPDGGHILYLEGPFDRGAVWAAPVRSGQPSGAPVAVQREFKGHLFKATTDGALLYSRREHDPVNAVFVVDRRPASSDRVTTHDGIAVSWSKDGLALAMMRPDPQGTSTLVVRQQDTGEERSYQHPGLSYVSPIWLPDRTGILTIVDEQRDGKAVRVFHRLDLATGTFQRLFERDTRSCSSPTGAACRRTDNGAVSPDGRTLFLGRSSGPGENSSIDTIVGVDITTGAERTVHTFTPAEGAAHIGLSLSPDGRVLAVSAWTTLWQSARIFTVTVDGASPRDIVGHYDTGWLADDLRWTPDGLSLVFLAFNGNANWRLMRVPADGGTPQPDGLDFDTLAPLLGGRRMFPGNFNNFDLSPDGTRVAASTWTWTTNEVWALDVMALLRDR